MTKILCHAGGLQSRLFSNRPQTIRHLQMHLQFWKIFRRIILHHAVLASVDLILEQLDRGLMVPDLPAQIGRIENYAGKPHQRLLYGDMCGIRGLRYRNAYCTRKRLEVVFGGRVIRDHLAAEHLHSHAGRFGGSHRAGIDFIDITVTGIHHKISVVLA